MIGATRWLLVGAACGVACAGTSTPVGEPISDEQGERATTSADGDTVRAAEDGLPYLTMNGVELTMDVHVPPAEFGDDRSVVVLFHGLSSATNEAEDVTVVADAATAAGMVVFAPEWIAGDPFPLLRDDITMLRSAGECAVAFAQREAGSFGGEPTRIVTSGFSAGTGPALTAAISTAPDTDGCVATPASDESTEDASDAVVGPVVGMVLGDGEYFWQSEPFDAAFADDPAGMLSETDLLIEPATWTADPTVRLRLWAAADRTAPRALDVTADADDWLTARDGDGSIRSELDEAGALDDGSIDYVDNAQLLERRAAAAGFDIDLRVFPGGHTVADKAPEIVELLIAAAGES